MRPDEAPRLPGWVTLREMADGFGVSRQTVHAMMQAGEFETLHSLGGYRWPLWLVRESEFEKVRESRRFPRSKGRGGGGVAASSDG